MAVALGMTEMETLEPEPKIRVLGGSDISAESVGVAVAEGKGEPEPEPEPADGGGALGGFDAELGGFELGVFELGAFELGGFDAELDAELDGGVPLDGGEDGSVAF